VRNRIFFKLMLAFAIVIAVATITLDVSIRRPWEDSIRAEIERNLREKTQMFAANVLADHQHSIQQTVTDEGHAANARATVIDDHGKVLADSEAQASEMENHAQRPEFIQALQGKLGEDTRTSHTLGIPFLYVAVPIPHGAVRLAYPLSEIQASLARIRHTLFLSSAVVFGLALILAAVAAQFTARRLRRIVQFAEKIAAGDLTARIAEPSTDEVGQVASALDKTARHLEENFSALQNSQRQLETLLNSMQDAVVAIGPDEKVQWANRMMDRLMPQHVRLQSPLVETVRDPEFLEAVRTASKKQNVSTARAVSIVHGRTFDVTAAPMPGGGAVAVLRDLTEREQIEKTRRDFIANVSHELRTPLTSIQGYTETLIDSTPQGDHAREFLDIIRKNAMRMSRLTEDLLTLARVESGEQRFEVFPVSASELLVEILQAFKEIARMQGVELEIEKDDDTHVNADREAIHQVFSNLVENALKYGASGGRIVLGAIAKEDGVEFYVRDFGAGISSEHLPRLFERFYRVDKARSRESGGTGLGLAIAKHIVLAHGGTIRANSDLNHGSSFFFVLPLAPAQEASFAGE
jgi:two-component system phosphate regulon sensor histidine kinase PhoR